MIKLLWNTALNQNDSFELYWGKYHEKNSKDWIYFLLQNNKLRRRADSDLHLS